MWRMIAAPTQADKPQEPTTFRVFNPATGDVLRELPNHSRDHVLAEMARVRRASPRWAETPIEERAKKLERDLEQQLRAKYPVVLDEQQLAKLKVPKQAPKQAP